MHFPALPAHARSLTDINTRAWQQANTHLRSQERRHSAVCELDTLCAKEEHVAGPHRAMDPSPLTAQGPGGGSGQGPKQAAPVSMQRCALQVGQAGCHGSSAAHAPLPCVKQEPVARPCG